MRQRFHLDVQVEGMTTTLLHWHGDLAVLRRRVTGSDQQQRQLHDLVAGRVSEAAATNKGVPADWDDLLGVVSCCSACSSHVGGIGVMPYNAHRATRPRFEPAHHPLSWPLCPTFLVRPRSIPSPDTGIEAGYLGLCVGHPFDESLSWGLGKPAGCLQQRPANSGTGASR
jgi:hypothetical protein